MKIAQNKTRLLAIIKPLTILVFVLALPLAIALNSFGGQASALFTDTSNGQIQVTLDTSPSKPATVTATRAAAVPAQYSATGQDIPPETVTLSKPSGAKAGNSIYTSGILPYSGDSTSTTPCLSMGRPWMVWQISVTGSATGSGSAQVYCGGLVKVTISTSNKTGTITGVAKSSATACSAASTYQLVKPGTDPGTVTASSTTGSSLPIDSAGNFTISGVTPGTWDLYIGCVTGVSQNQVLSSTNITVTAGKTVTATMGAPGSASSTTPTCESGDGISLAWLMCPLINGLADTVDSLFNNVIQPLLIMQPIDTSSSSPIFKGWSNFRIYGNIFLIIALLVVVFGQSVGGGLIDAYSARKILPRLLVTAILINLSIYIVALAVDFTNIIGGGIQTLLTAPFTASDTFHLSLNGGAQATLAISGLVTGAAGAATIWATVAVGWAFAWPMLQFLLLFVLLPAVIAFIGILATIIIRQGLIIFLVVVSPVAFAMYVLPNTEQYFRKWWDLLFRALLVYPIIAVLFSLSTIMAVTISTASASQGGMLAALSQLMAIVALIIPLFLIPFSFKLAGGLLGKFHEVATGLGKRGSEAIKGSAQNPNSLRNRVKGNAGAAINRGRAQGYREVTSAANAMGGRRGRLTARANALLLGGAIEKESQLNAQSKQRTGMIKDNGDDSIINARTSFVDPADGKRKTLDGKTVSESDWFAAKRLHPTMGDLQAAADYRSTKVLTSEEADQFHQNFGLMAQQQGLSPEETTGLYTGLSFARQNERGEFKYGRYVQDPTTGAYTFQAVGDQGSYEGDVDPTTGSVVEKDKSRSGNFVKEQYTKRGSWDASKMFGSYFQSMGDIKQTHLDKLNDFDAITNSGGTLTKDQLDLQEHSKDQLKQIMEIEDTFAAGGQYRDPTTGQVVESGLSGASAATRAAFVKMRSIGVPPGTPPGTRKTGNAHLDQLRDEIDNGQTYEATHSPKPGDFGSKSRPFIP
jgi:hypothetical protein